MNNAGFQTDLPIPPILRPVNQDATIDFYTITQRASTHEFIPGLSTPVWGYNGEDHDMMTQFDTV